MTPAAIMLLAVLAAAPLGLRWDAWHRKLTAKAEERKRCVHSFGPVAHIKDGWGVFAYQRLCHKCGEHKHVNEDGTDYVPRHRRG